ncbi:hypothetical protein BGW80DRAFT_1308962, partial [Lactifluus volemus]
MSSTALNPTASAYYSVYKSAVYINLFVGIAWGGQLASLLLLSPHILFYVSSQVFLSHYMLYLSTSFCKILPCLCLRRGDAL